MDEISVQTEEVRSRVVLHQIPCKLSLDGPARVSTFFVPEQGADGA